MSENKDFHNQAGLMTFLGSIIFVVVFFVYMVTLNKGVDLGENVKDINTTGEKAFNLADVKEPWVSTPEVVAAGQKLFKMNCASCHGEKGDLVGGLPTARNLVEGKWLKGEGIINHFKFLVVGSPAMGMPSFKETLKPNERWAILNFVESITNNKSKDAAEDVSKFAGSAQ